MVKITEKEIAPDILDLELAGRLAVGAESQELQEKVEALIAQGRKKLILDLTDLKYMDSTGLGTVVTCFTKMRQAGGQLRVAGANKTILNLFKITRLDKVLPLEATVESATSSLAG
jgi:anti-sigma B factor antagonist